MSQDDLVIANQTFPQTRADINANLQALGSKMSGSSAPSTTYPYMWWADTTNGVLKQRDAGDSAWVIRATLSDDRVITKTTSYTVTLGDYGKTILCSASGGAFTVTLLAAATAGDGFIVNFKKTDSSANAVTLDGDSSETIDGSTTITLPYQYDAVTLRCDGSNWHVVDVGHSAAAPAKNTASLAHANMGMIQASMLGACINKQYNGPLHIWSRGTSGTITAGTPSIAADGVAVSCTGANVAWARVTGRVNTPYGLKVTGATSVTDVAFMGRIESIFCYPFYPAGASAQVTIQAKIYNGTGAAVTPTLTIKHANSADNWGASTTDVSAVSLQECADSAVTQVAYTFATASGTLNGLEWTIDMGNNFTTGSDTVEIFEIDIRVTPGVATGLNSNPPVAELRDITLESLLCLRYLPVINAVSANNPVGPACETSTTSAQLMIILPVRTRTAVTGVTASASTHITLNHAGGNIASTAIAYASSSLHMVNLTITVASGLTAGWATHGYLNNSSGYLRFTGAELF